jgi:segregation and condensation protein A
MSPHRISLPRFEGPLDLLLELVRKHEVDIVDIPIAAVTRQYLDYIKEAKDGLIELGPEFAYIASLLIHMKSCRLLAEDPLCASGEDPQQELVHLLEEHAAFRAAAGYLGERLGIAESAWSHPSIDQFQDFPVPELLPPGSMNLLQILRLAQQALNTARIFDLVNPAHAPVTVEEMIAWLENRLPGEGRTGFEALLAEQARPDRKVALFLATLEMTKSARIAMAQEECFGPILLEMRAPAQ